MSQGIKLRIEINEFPVILDLIICDLGENDKRLLQQV